MARPKKDDARTITYKVRLNEKENRILTEASIFASVPKSEVFRTALYEYHHQNVRNDHETDGKGQDAAPDMCVSCGSGIINIRVGAIILKDGRFLMVRSGASDYFYSVGGRIKFGETAEEAVIREVFEETGVRMEIDHLGFVQENYFIGDSPAKMGKEIYELGYYFYMNVPEGFEPVCGSVTEDGQTEYLEWVSPDESRTIFPPFFRTELDITDLSVKHKVKDDRFYIRQMTSENLEPLYTLLSDPDVMEYLEPPFSYEQTERFLKVQGLAASPRILAVDDKDHCFMGYVIYHDYDEKSKEIGWVLKKEKWGQGMAGLLTKQLIAMAASEGKDTVIECVPEQLATRRIAEKHGFQKADECNGLIIYRRKRHETVV